MLKRLYSANLTLFIGHVQNNSVKEMNGGKAIELGKTPSHLAQVPLL